MYEKKKKKVSINKNKTGGKLSKKCSAQRSINDQYLHSNKDVQRKHWS